ncbi:hypothetical protein KOW79_005107 [Hemibagrus wyckioides]|uniref:LIM domain only protein 7 n=1 Tax=Hemibagrus wyckioides TaxID=337641 RepID=A0A9D3P1C7_9TELE|nr:hypothetical protein KOW79_005107 [Hemibagrus wyckioides]
MVEDSMFQQMSELKVPDTYTNTTIRHQKTIRRLKNALEDCASSRGKYPQDTPRHKNSTKEPELVFNMSENYRRSAVVAPKTTSQFNQFLPSKDKQSGYVPAPLRKKRTDSIGSEENRRSWASPMFTEEDGSFSRLLQKNSDSDGAMSLSDIPVEQALQKIRYDDLQKMREQVKENEDKWQDDLTKWKNRRKSVNSDIMKKKEEREQIEVLTSGSTRRKSKTFKEMEEERESREPSYRNRFSTFSTSDDQDVFEEPTPKTRVLPSRSNTVDIPYSLSRSKVRSLPSLLDDEPETGSLPTDKTDAPSSPVQSSLGHGHSLLDDPVPTSATSKPSLLEPASTTQSTRTSTTLQANSSSKPITKSSISATPTPAPRQDQSQTSLYKPVATEAKQPIAPRVSASLPRSYQKSDTARITSVITPRPFGAPNAKIASLPRSYTVGDPQKHFNGETNSSMNTTINSRTSSVQEKEQVFPPSQPSSAITPVSRVAPQPKVSPVSSTQQESYSDMRISLNQKPNSSHDFGFQTNWDSTGAIVKSIKQGSPAELFHLQVGDKILAVNGQKVADMSYEQWKRSMDKALQDGSLFMDIRRQGKNSSPEPYGNMSLDFTSRPAMDPTVKSLNVSSQPINRLPSNGIKGGINEEPVRLRNEGGSENQIADLPVPSHSASSTRWSWDPEEERRRQEKWQKEQDRQLQEKYQRDQEKLKEEFRKAQQEAVTEVTKQYQEEVRSLEMEREASRLKEEEERREEERKRREQQERLEEERKRREQQERLEEERKRREQQERLEEERKRREQQERLEEERKRREQQERLEEERKRREEQKKREEIKRLEEQRKKEEEELKRRAEENRRREEEALRLQRKREEEEERRRQEAQQRLQANDAEYAFPELSYSHRAKSKSTPELDDKERTDIKAVNSGLGESFLNKVDQNKKEPTSQAEAERQQIIQDMKKKTSVQPDSNWIRQSSVNNVNKQPVYVPMRRGESLDNLDMTKNHQSWRSSWTPGTSSSIPDYSRPYSSLSSNRPLLPQSTSTTPTQPDNQLSSRNRSVSGKKTCTYCDMTLGKGAAMIIESLGLCFHLHCFKCFQCKADLGGSESGAEVRIRNKQLFCTSCYMRVKTGQPTAM